MEPVVISIPGEPRGKGAPRHAAVMGRDGRPVMANGRPIIAKHTDRKTGEYMGKIAALAQLAMKGRAPFEGPVHVAMVVRMEIPASWPDWKRVAAAKGLIGPDKKPDEDNVKKAVYDAFTGVVWNDDVQVCGSGFRKEFHEQIGVFVKVTTLPKASSRITRRDQLPAPQDLAEAGATNVKTEAA